AAAADDFSRPDRRPAPGAALAVFGHVETSARHKDVGPTGVLLGTLAVIGGIVRVTKTLKTVRPEGDFVILDELPVQPDDGGEEVMVCACFQKFGAQIIFAR